MREQFPDGFDCEGCYLNGVSTWARDNTELFPKSDNPGVDATIEAIEGITGLRDQLLGDGEPRRASRTWSTPSAGSPSTSASRSRSGPAARVTSATSSPASGSSNGHDTLWFARAREGSDDYSRMARQKCVMNAMLEQVSPQVALRNFEKIAKASSAMISTSIPCQRGRPLHRPGAQGARARRSPRSPSCRRSIDTARPGHRRRSRAMVAPGDRPVRGRRGHEAEEEEETQPRHRRLARQPRRGVRRQRVRRPRRCLLIYGLTECARCGRERRASSAWPRTLRSDTTMSARANTISPTPAEVGAVEEGVAPREVAVLVRAPPRGVVVGQERGGPRPDPGSSGRRWTRGARPRRQRQCPPPGP